MPFNGQNEWEFSWTAPLNNAGPITFYYATNCANNNTIATGDIIYISQFKIKPAVELSINMIQKKDINVFYDSQNACFDIQYLLSKEKNVAIKIIDMSGQELYSNSGGNKMSGTNHEKIKLKKELSTGVYFINISYDQQSFSRKVFVK
jgi:hypothetical protein